MLLAFSMVQKIVTELLDAAREEEKVVTTKSLFRLLKNIISDSS
jgi:hypothetical protein